MIKIPTMFVRNELEKGHPVINQIKPECQWVLDGEGIATQKLDGTNVKIENGKLYRRQKPIDREYDMASYVECDPANPNDKYLFDAFNALEDKSDGIYEAIGPKIQGNAEKTEKHILVSVVPPDIKLNIWLGVSINFEGIKQFLSEHDIEGIVFHHEDGRMAKIKKKDFGLKR